MNNYYFFFLHLILTMTMYIQSDNSSGNNPCHPKGSMGQAPEDDLIGCVGDLGRYGSYLVRKLEMIENRLGKQNFFTGQHKRIIFRRDKNEELRCYGEGTFLVELGENSQGHVDFTQQGTPEITPSTTPTKNIIKPNFFPSITYRQPPTIKPVLIRAEVVEEDVQPIVSNRTVKRKLSLSDNDEHENLSEKLSALVVDKKRRKTACDVAGYDYIYCRKNIVKLIKDDDLNKPVRKGGVTWGWSNAAKYPRVFLVRGRKGTEGQAMKGYSYGDNNLDLLCMQFPSNTRTNFRYEICCPGTPPPTISVSKLANSSSSIDFSVHQDDGSVNLMLQGFLGMFETALMGNFPQISDNGAAQLSEPIHTQPAPRKEQSQYTHLFDMEITGSQYTVNEVGLGRHNKVFQIYPNQSGTCFSGTNTDLSFLENIVWRRKIYPNKETLDYAIRSMHLHRLVSKSLPRELGINIEPMVMFPLENENVLYMAQCKFPEHQLADKILKWSTVPKEQRRSRGVPDMIPVENSQHGITLDEAVTYLMEDLLQGLLNLVQRNNDAILQLAIDPGLSNIRIVFLEKEEGVIITQITTFDCDPGLNFINQQSLHLDPEIFSLSKLSKSITDKYNEAMGAFLILKTLFTRVCTDMLDRDYPDLEGSSVRKALTYTNNFLKNLGENNDSPPPFTLSEDDLIAYQKESDHLILQLKIGQRLLKKMEPNSANTPFSSESLAEQEQLDKINWDELIGFIKNNSMDALLTRVSEIAKNATSDSQLKKISDVSDNDEREEVYGRFTSPETFICDNRPITEDESSHPSNELYYSGLLLWFNDLVNLKARIQAPPKTSRIIPIESTGQKHEVDESTGRFEKNRVAGNNSSGTNAQLTENNETVTSYAETEYESRCGSACMEKDSRERAHDFIKTTGLKILHGQTVDWIDEITHNWGIVWGRCNNALLATIVGGNCKKFHDDYLSNRIVTGDIQDAVEYIYSVINDSDSYLNKDRSSLLFFQTVSLVLGGLNSIIIDIPRNHSDEITIIDIYHEKVTAKNIISQKCLILDFSSLIKKVNAATALVNKPDTVMLYHFFVRYFSINEKKYILSALSP